MVIRVQTLRLWFMAMVLFYYAGFMSFFSGLLSGRHSGHTDIAQAAGGSAIRQLVGMAILGLGLYFVFRLKDRSLASFLGKHVYWLLLLGFIVCSVFWSVDTGVSVRRILALFILFIAALVVLYELPPERVLTLIFRTIGWAAVVGILYAVVNPGQAFIQGEGLRSGAFLGIFSDKNAGARSYVYALVLAYGLGLFRKRSDQVLIGALLVAILLSRSATAAGMLAGGIGLVWLFNRSRVEGNPKRTFNRLVLLSLSLVMLCVAGNYAYEEILLLFGRDPSLTNRTIIWEMLDYSLQLKPMFGYGFGAFWASAYVQDFVETWGFIGNAHSSYMEMRLIGGYTGLCVLIAAFTGSFVRSIKGFVFYPDSPVFAVTAAIILLQASVSYIAFIIPNHVSFDMFLFAVVAVIAGRYGHRKPRRTEMSVSEYHINGPVKIRRQSRPAVQSRRLGPVSSPDKQEQQEY